MSADVRAAPIEGSGRAPADAEAAGGPRAQALAGAREAALEAAIASLEISVDAAALVEVRAQSWAWTGSYRVLEVRAEGAAVEVRVEVEIDLPRLRKRVAEREAAPAGRGFRWDGLSVEGCGPVEATRVSDALRAYGIVATGGASSLSISLRCEARGAVSHTFVQAAHVEIEARTLGGVELRRELSTWGFGASAAEAQEVALVRSIGELAEELAVEARAELELVVERPWPAARVASIEQTLLRSVIGVDEVELAGISAEGAVLLRVRGSVDAEGLGRALQGLSFPGFSLVGLRVDNGHTLRVRLQ